MDLQGLEPEENRRFKGLNDGFPQISPQTVAELRYLAGLESKPNEEVKQINGIEFGFLRNGEGNQSNRASLMIDNEINLASSAYTKGGEK